MIVCVHDGEAGIVGAGNAMKDLRQGHVLADEAGASKRLVDFADVDALEHVDDEISKMGGAVDQ